MKEKGKENIENTSECFRHLLPEEVEMIRSHKKQIHYLKGETLFKQGAFAPYILFVVEGLVRVYLQTGRKKQLNLHLARQGDYIAFSSVFDQNIYKYSAVALKDSLICMIDKIAMKEVLLKNPKFAMNITSRNFRNENRYMDIIKNISYKQMRGKLASTLLYLSSEKFKNDSVFLHMSRLDIAEFASITNESAIKFLKEFEKEKLIELEGKDIRICNQEGLEQISKHG